MANYENKSKYMPKKVTELYEKIDNVEKFYKERIDTHVNAYEKLKENLYDGKELKYDLITDPSKRDDIINRSIDEKVKVYREKAKKDYGISPEKEHFKKRSKDELDDFILTIYTGKKKDELKYEIQDVVEKMPQEFDRNFYIQRILMDRRNRAPHDVVIRETLYNSLESYIKEGDKKEILDYLSQSNIDKLVNYDLLQKNDMIKLLKIYNRGEEEITREKIVREYDGQIPKFLKTFDYSEIERKNKKEFEKTDETMPDGKKVTPDEKEERKGEGIEEEKDAEKKKKEIKDAIKEGDLSPEKAVELNLRGYPGSGEAINEMVSKGELSEDFINRYKTKENEIIQKQKEVKEKIIEGELTPEKAVDLASSGRIPEIGQVINEMSSKGELSEDFINRLNARSENIQKEKEVVKEKIKEGELSPEEVVEYNIRGNPGSLEAINEMASKGELSEDFINRYKTKENEIIQKQKKEVK